MKNNLDKINGKIKDFGFYTGFSVNKIDLKFLENLIKKNSF